MRTLLAVLFISTFACSAFSADQTLNARLIESSKASREKLFRTNFKSLEKTSNAAVEKEISKLMDRLDTVRNIHPRRNPAQEAAVAEPNILETEPNSQAVGDKSKDDPGFDPNEIKALMESTKEPNSIKEPLQVAEILYNNGYKKEAEKFYLIAIKRKTSMGQDITDDDRAWMLLQISNCRSDDPNSAAAALDELIRRYPNSNWAQAAAAKRDLVNWYMQAKPDKLVGAIK